MQRSCLRHFRCGIFSPLLRFLNDLGNEKPRKIWKCRVGLGSVCTEKGNDQGVTNLCLSPAAGGRGWLRIRVAKGKDLAFPEIGDSQKCLAAVPGLVGTKAGCHQG